jgi:hypothetical protein
MLPVTIAAFGRISVSVHAGAAVNACGVNVGNLGVALCALHPFQIRGVRNFRNIAVAGRARQRAVHGLGKPLGIYRKRNFLSLPLFLKPGRPVAR